LTTEAHRPERRGGKVAAKVYMVIARYSPVVGGAEIQLKRLAQRLVNLDVTIVTARIQHAPRFEILDSLPGHRLSTFGEGRLGSLSFALSLLRFLLKKRGAYDVLHAHLASSHAIVCAFIGALLKKKTIVKLGASRELGEIMMSKKSWFGRWKLDYLKKHVDKFICTNQEMEKELRAEGFPETAIESIPNGVDPNDFHPLSEQERTKLKTQLGIADRWIVMSVARLTPQKSLDTLLAAWKEAVEKAKRGLLLIIGDGPQKGELQALSVRLGLESHVRFLGTLKSEEVKRYLQASDVFVLPSITEGISNSLLEAMAVGLPSVVTNIGGLNEMIVSGVNGFLVETGDAEGLTRTMLSLWEDRDECGKLGTAARDQVCMEYNLETIAQRYYSLYDAILQETEGASGKRGTHEQA
jgi:glycosyltransferase involved in cell wall biosynthesis